VAAYVLRVVKGIVEWVTVPVLALALCLPHGALVYWLSSSSFSIAQAVLLLLLHLLHPYSQGCTLSVTGMLGMLVAGAPAMAYAPALWTGLL
jgi:hypothetical protein